MANVKEYIEKHGLEKKVSTTAAFWAQDKDGTDRVEVVSWHGRRRCRSLRRMASLRVG
jgi:hypothetical protein